jgi:hypothetical protein
MWNLRPSERLHEWKEFRDTISTSDLENAVRETGHLWSYAPYVTHYLDPIDTANWPDPWALLHENYYDDLAKSLGMLYTLYLCRHFNNQLTDLEIRIYKNPTNQDVYNVVWINDGLYILNFEFDTVVNKTQLEENLILMNQISLQDLQLGLY